MTSGPVAGLLGSIRERLAAGGAYFDGPHARHELAEYLIGNGIIRLDDLTRLRLGGRS